MTRWRLIALLGLGTTVACDPFPAEIDGGVTAEGVNIRLLNLTTESILIGLAETGSGSTGWYGEDCIDDNGDNDLNLCHEFDGDRGALTLVNAVEEVAAGNTTLFSSDLPGVTYYLEMLGGANDGLCWAWGDDPTHYDAFNCEPFPE